LPDERLVSRKAPTRSPWNRGIGGTPVCEAERCLAMTFQMPVFPVKSNGPIQRRGGGLFRPVLDTAGRFATFVGCCHCGRKLGRECPPISWESHRCPRAPGARSSLMTRSAFITASSDASEGRSSLQGVRPMVPTDPGRALWHAAGLDGAGTSRGQAGGDSGSPGPNSGQTGSQSIELGGNCPRFRSTVKGAGGRSGSFVDAVARR
jgi:hypothetical protein